MANIEIFCKYSELLNNILKKTFDDKLKLLEKRSYNHLSIISSTKKLTNNITSLSIKLKNQIIKNKSEKPNSLRKNSKYKNINSPKLSYTKIPPQYKTPLRSEKKNKNNESKTAGNVKKTDSKIKHNLNINNKDKNKLLDEKSKTLINNKKFKKINEENDKLNKTFIHSFNKIIKEDLRKSYTKLKEKEKDKINKDIKSTIINKDKNINFIASNEKSRNKNYGVINKLKKEMGNKIEYNSTIKSLNKTFERRKSKHIKNDNSSFSSHIFQKNKTKEKNKNIRIVMGYKDKNCVIDKGNKNKIISMESNLEKDEKLFHQDDQLLIIPITDRDFKIMNLY